MADRLLRAFETVQEKYLRDPHFPRRNPVTGMSVGSAKSK